MNVAEKNVIRIKTNIIDGFNKINQLLTKNTFDEESFKIILDKYKISESFLIRKLFSYMYNYPWIITYFNKYMNYLGIVSCEFIEFIKSYRHILQCNGILDSRLFFYMNSSVGKDSIQEKIINLFNKYFSEQFKINFNYKELLFYYDLYLNGIITNQEIHEIDLLINNNEKTINLPDFTPSEKNIKPVSVEKIIERYRDSSRGIDFINNEIYKRKMNLCRECKHFGREIVPFDGNIKNINDIDVLIVNLNPDLNDLREKRTFRENNIIRQNISLFPKDIKWILINLVPCVFKSKSELGKDVNEIKNNISGCHKIVLDFIKENIKPKLVILIGQETTSIFLPATEFEETLGSLVNDQYISVLHSNSMRHSKAQIRGKKYWESVQNIVKEIKTCVKPVAEDGKNESEKTSNSEIIEKKNPIVIEKHLNKINNKYLLLDVKEIEDGKSILMIFTDEEGNKHYEKKKNTTIGYIKKSTFKDCGILTDSVDAEFSMTKMDKFKLIKLLREKMAKLKGN